MCVPFYYLSVCLILHWSHGISHVEQPDLMDGIWQPVTGTKHQCFVYSAFLDKRNQDLPVVRVVGVVWRTDSDRLLCRLKLKDSCTVTVHAQIQKIRETKSLSYSAAYILCPLHIMNPNDVLGGTVSIVTQHQIFHKPANKLPVLSIEPRKHFKNKFHICVPAGNSPMNYSMDHILEWFEMHREIGVSKFYMYHRSVSRSVSCALEEYNSRGVLELREYNPDKIEMEMGRLPLQLAVLQDCLYRSMSRAQYLIIIDTEEWMLPQYHLNFKTLFKKIRSDDRMSQNSSAYMFKEALFYTFWPDDPYAPAPLLTARKTLRIEEPLPYQNRTKYIVRPYRVTELGLNFVWQFVHYAYSIFEVPIELGLLHHYSPFCEYEYSQTSPEGVCNTMPYITDRSAHKWSKKTFKRVDRVKKRLFNKNNRCQYYAKPTTTFPQPLEQAG